MAITAATHPTLLDVANLQDPDGTTSDVVEILAQQNEMIMDAVVYPSNEPNSHRHVVRSGLPQGAWRGYNQGVQPSKSKTVSARSTIGNYENYAEVDRDLANLNGNSAEWRLQQETPFMEEMTQTMQKQLIFGDESNSGEENGFTGFYKHYADGRTSVAESADNVINFNGVSNPAAGVNYQSVLLVCWDPMCTFGIYPKGTKAGLQVTDKGEVTIEDADGSGGRMEAYRTHYKWQMGLVVRDWRYNVRIANVKKAKDITTNADREKLLDLMFEALNLLPTEKGRCAFYMSRDIRTRLYQGIADKVAQSTLTIDQVSGVRTMAFHGVPIRRVDAMAALEDRVLFS